ncbi:deoR-family transcriptional repressor of sugar metabolism [Mycoplasma mobile 163K]|uniref:DeoR-family transcriptional repressor of sugar metabolism n=1 Tax=Mycoplasma mobile (strain ATCC 43663 / 163K / NCTC 11711) TaxID=267748 RepID=Q6KHM6_MYCM1|nr:DeoR/GlpR family DNA-binding transcription regulator [[Mycoplasma] mobile]AAT27904.1 deoR-family transcriptional repressor of sugar metabolism [Mycoplasma mobile 163K]
MLIIENKLLEYIKENKIVKPKTLETVFGLKSSTVRRYLIKLEEKKKIERNFGQIKYIGFIDSNRIASQEVEKNKPVKLQLAKKAASLAKDYKNVFISSGSSCYYVLDFLEKDINLYTNSIFNAIHAIDLGFKNVNIIGGHLKPASLSTVSSEITMIDNLKFQIAFLGVNGIDSKGSLTANDINEGVVKKYIANNSDLVVVLAEKEKFNSSAFYDFTPKNKIILVVSDYTAPFDFPNLSLIKL